VAAIPQVGFGGTLNLPTGSKTVTASTNYQGGVIGTTGAPTLTLNSGVAVTNETGYSLLYGTGGRWNLKGSGRFLNKGTLVYTNILNVGLSWQTSDATFVNEGFVDFVGESASGGLYWYDVGRGAFTNANGGVIQVSRAYTYKIQNAGHFASYDSTIRVTNNGTLWLDNVNYYITNTTFETYGTGSIRLRRSPELVHGTAVGKGLLLYSGSFQVDSGGTVMDVSGQGIRFGAGYWVASSGTFENKGLMTTYGSGGDQTQIPRGGLFKNTGTVRHFNTSNVGIRPYNSGSRFENHGTWVCSNSIFYMDQVAGLTFSNMPGGVFQVYGSGESKFFRNNYTFHNEGTFEVLDGFFDFEDGNPAIGPATMSGGVLKLGTWKCMGGNINFSFTATDITTIDTDAAVILSGTSWMDELDRNGGSLDTIHGTLGLHAGKQYTNSSALVTSDTTTFEFGLDDSGNDPLLTIGGSTTLQCKIDVVDLGTLIPGRYRVIEMAPGETLTDGGITLGEVTTEQTLRFRVAVYEGTGEDGYVLIKVGSGAGSIITVR